MRLQKYVSDCGLMSRRAAEKEIEAGSFTVNGEVAVIGQQIEPEKDIIKYKGTRVRNGGRKYYIALNKPAGYVTTANDEMGRQNVCELVSNINARLYPVGRLDKDTSGMLLLTNDGAFSHALLAPKRHVPKYYRMQLARPYEESYAQQLAEGLVLADGTHCLPAEILPVLNTDRMAVICLHEGKYHQVRRMLAAVGNHVEQLQRVAIGNLFLPIGLQIGACQKLTSTQISLLSQQPDPKFLWELAQNSNF